MNLRIVNMSTIKCSILLKIFIIFNIICNSFATTSVNNNKSNNNLSKDEINIYKEMIRDYYRPPEDISYYGNLDDKNKRAINRFKSFILARGNLDSSMEDEEESNELLEYLSFPRIMPKRIPGAILSWAIPTANRVKVLNTSYRPPGISRPAA